MAARVEGRLDFYGSVCLFPVLLGFGYYSLSRVLRVDKLDPLWRRVIILCAATMVFYNICCGVFGYTALFMLKKDSKSDSLGMILCRASLLGMDLADGWLYCGFLCFYFHRLNIAFARASDSVRISKCTSRTMYFSIFLMALFPPPMAVWNAIDSTEPWSEWGGFYCQSPINKARFDNYWTIWSVAWTLISIIITYLYIVKLRQIMIVVRPGERASVSVEHQNAKIVYIVKKAAVITIVSCVTTIVLTFSFASQIFWLMDGFFNCVLIFCNFEAGNRLFNVIFYPCIQEGWFCQQKCIDLSFAISELSDRMSSNRASHTSHTPIAEKIMVDERGQMSPNPNAQITPF